MTVQQDHQSEPTKASGQKQTVSDPLNASKVKSDIPIEHWEKELLDKRFLKEEEDARSDSNVCNVRHLF